MFEGVPPNMSVSTSTPSPWSARSASAIALRISSTLLGWARRETAWNSGASGTIRRKRLEELLAQPVVGHDDDADAHGLPRSTSPVLDVHLAVRPSRPSPPTARQRLDDRHRAVAAPGATDPMVR